MFFAWVKGLRGPEAQLWINDQLDETTGKSKSTLFKIKLSEGEKSQSLDYLAMKYGKYATPNQLLQRWI